MVDKKTEETFELYKSIANEAIMGFIVFDIEDQRKCTFLNRIGFELLQLPYDSNLSEITLDSLIPSKTHEEMRSFTLDILKNDGFYQDMMMSKFNNTQFIANLGIKTIKIEDKKHVLLMIQDVTMQKKLQKEINLKQQELQKAFQDLLVQNKQLKELDIAKNRFIALTTHELRTPLSAMIGSVELIREKLFDSEEQHDEFIDIIYEQGHRLMELVNDILDFAKIQAGRMDLYVNEDNVLALVESEVEALESVAKNNNITIEIEHDNQDYKCYFDQLRLNQVITNILSNAIKYNNDNGSVKITLEQDNDYVKVSVIDTGKGISQENMEKVFDEFETLGKVANHQKGTGLGMPISKKLIEAQGGEIHLKSELGKGSTFWILIPKNKILEEENYRVRVDDFDLAS